MGWSNVLTNLGVKNKDKRTGAQIELGYYDKGTCEALYQSDDIAARIVDRIPEELALGRILKHPSTVSTLERTISQHSS